MSRSGRSDGGAEQGAAADPAIAELLDAVRAVRTTLAIDLSAAAGALDAENPQVASDIIAATSAELKLVASQTREPASAQRAPHRRSRRTRALLALPAVPLIGAIAMTTAAALNGSGAKPAVHHIATSAPPQHATATTTLHRLEHVVTHHPKAAQVIAVADDLHKQLTQMIATSTDDPAQLHVVRQLLSLEQKVLESSKVPGTQLALAASRAIAELLEHRPSHPQSKHTAMSHSTVATAPTTHPTPTTTPTQTHVQPAPQKHQSKPPMRTEPSSRPTNPLFGAGLFNGS
ncbi:MAG TPA: hypothetical protein VHC43_04650 [Mycobacteriales bacterium]|nr:hypothetical protein [Mycobacteriales bacterium]